MAVINAKKSNKKLAIYKTFSKHVGEMEQKEEAPMMSAISITSLAEQGVKVIHII